MAHPKKQAATRRNAKLKGAGQRTLFDLFPPKLSATRPASPISETASIAGGGIEDAQSSDLEVVGAVETSSSPVPTDADALSDATNEGLDAESRRETARTRTRRRLKPPMPKSSASTPGSSQAISDGKSRDDPIVVDTSPIRPNNVNRVSDKPFFSIFSPRRAPPVISASSDTLAREPSPFQRLNRRGMAVPYPARDCQHVRADQTNFITFPCPFERRFKAIRLDLEADVAKLSLPADEPVVRDSPAQGDETSPCGPCPLPIITVTTSALTPQGSVEGNISVSHDTEATSSILADIPTHHRSYPSIERLVYRIQSGDTQEADPPLLSHELWTDRWRPRRADEVLGNEERALYLRAWLLALRVHIDSTPASSQDSLGTGAKGSTGKKKQPTAKQRGTKRPRVVRQVDRRRKRRRMDSEEADDGWIVYDERDFDPDAGAPSREVEDEDDIAFCQRSYARLQRVAEEVEEPICLEPTARTTAPEADEVPKFSYRAAQFANQLHNTILLSGPSGCGKTAAVYACAEELGWDVFEVYPGVGERSGAALNKLIGDVGKNHIVQQTQRQQRTFFDSVATLNAGALADGSASQTAESRKRVFKRIDSENLDEEGRSQTQNPAHTELPTHTSEPPPVSQSIVLIEEVDVLYESDANFWPSLINIIRECRRPVVMTCNDVSLVPIRDLPLQDILVFQPPAPALATSYLQCVAILEQQPIERSTVSRLYRRVAGTPIGYARGSSTDLPAHCPDLRQSLLQLQFSSSSVPISPPSAFDTNSQQASVSHDQSSLKSPHEDTREDLSRIRSLDTLHSGLSFADCHLHRRQLDDLVDTMTADTGAANDELGYRILHNDALTTGHATINTSFYHQDQAVMETLLSRCSSAYSLPTGLHGGVDPGEEHTARVLSVLEDVHVPADVLANLSAAVLDYEPWVRYMVTVDDAAEAIYVEAQAGKDGARKTRNSLKAVQPVRYLPIRESSRLTLTHTALRL